jgi:hypothetical protein
VPAAAIDSQENKHLFVRYIEKSENLQILTSTLSRASEPRHVRKRQRSPGKAHHSSGQSLALLVASKFALV